MKSHRTDVLLLAGILACAAGLLFTGLTEKYLWQDEAQTAILAQRMLKFGRPLGYDGLNLVTTDMHVLDDATMAAQDGSAEAGIQFHVRFGDFKQDTEWKWQPWGLFAVAAVSLKALGPTTLAARLPFALAGLATVALLYCLVRKFTGSILLAALASLLLLCNPYWILHARQCRYYALSSLFLVLSLLCYLRWQRGEKAGAVGFLLAAWCFFQVDYGTIWPVLGVLFVHALAAGRRSWKETLGMAALVAASIAPFVFFYDLWQRRGAMSLPWKENFLGNLFNLNEYVLPLTILLLALGLLLWRKDKFSSEERSLVLISAGILVALALWIPSVATYFYLRYAIVAAPLGALLTAWLLVRALEGRWRWLLLPAAALLAITPWASLPLHALVPAPESYTRSLWVRGELGALQRELFGHQPDPNRIVVEWLRGHSKPSDEILVNYEDLPLIFYLPNPIRGGVGAFRVEDDSQGPPRFAVIRETVPFTNAPLFVREVRRYQWQVIPLNAPDIEWGDNPDPMGQYEDLSKRPRLLLLERVGP